MYVLLLRIPVGMSSVLNEDLRRGSFTYYAVCCFSKLHFFLLLLLLAVGFSGGVSGLDLEASLHNITSFLAGCFDSFCCFVALHSWFGGLGRARWIEERKGFNMGQVSLNLVEVKKLYGTPLWRYMNIQQSTRFNMEKRKQSTITNRAREQFEIKDPFIWLWISQ